MIVRRAALLVGISKAYFSRKCSEIFRYNWKSCGPEALFSSTSFVSTPREGDSEASVVPSFYRRQLPEPLIAFQSPQGKDLFKEAINAGYAEAYFSLAGNFTSQTEPAFCGLGSLAMVLNALEMDPGKNWKGVWRWYSDEMLECCAPLEVIKQKGVTMDEFACLAKCNGLNVKLKRFEKISSVEEFARDIALIVQNPDQHLVVSFDRQVLNQTGNGHFSPIGALHPSRQLALVLDVARFKYPPFWVPVDLLYKAMAPVDAVTGLSRGYFILSRLRRTSQTLIKFVDSFQPSAFLENLSNGNATAALSRSFDSMEGIIDSFLRIFQSTDSSDLSNPVLLPIFISSAGVDLAGPGLAKEHFCDVKSLQKEISDLSLYVEVRRVVLLHSKTYNLAQPVKDVSVLLTFLLLSLPNSIIDQFEQSVRSMINNTRSTSFTPLLRQELSRIQDQLIIMNEFSGCHRRDTGT